MSILHLFIIMIIVSYVILYTRPKTYTEILQTNVEDISPELLLEKQPVLIFDTIVNLDDIINTTFKYMYTFKKKQSLILEEQPPVYQNNSKYALFHNNTDADIKIDITKSRIKQNHFNIFATIIKEHESKNSIQIILKPHNVLILPYLFYFEPRNDIDVVFLNDIFHMITL